MERRASDESADWNSKQGAPFLSQVASFSVLSMKASFISGFLTLSLLRSLLAPLHTFVDADPLDLCIVPCMLARLAYV